MAENIEERSEPKLCESCGEVFGCGANAAGCWCAEIPLSPEAAAGIRTEFRDCLCPKCLSLRNRTLDNV